MEIRDKLRQASEDPRIQAIRCLGCHRLRAHPKHEDSRTWNCVCGSLAFTASSPHDDEMQLAIKLYQDEIDKANLWTGVAQEIEGQDPWRNPL